jgi:2-polyprenyl-6-methoxyphenol hydroxylase-like FAD-dependent oxidoreductase
VLTPQQDQAQGAAQAMEDAAALAAVLPYGTAPEAVPRHLELYEAIRAERAHRIQEFSRLAGMDWVDGKLMFDGSFKRSNLSMTN